MLTVIEAMDTPGPAEPHSRAPEDAGAGARAAVLEAPGLVGLVDWSHRPFRTCALFSAVSALWWLLVLGPCRSLCLLCLLLALGVLDDSFRSSVAGVEDCGVAHGFRVIHSGKDSSLQLLLKETCAFRQQNPGKFCLLMCSLCTFMAVLGRYIPGVVLSYTLILGIFLWPLLSSLDLGLWLKPILHKMEEGLRNVLHKLRDAQAARRLYQPQPETCGVELDLSSITPKLDSAVCKELCVSDTEPSDLSWTEGAFTLSEGHTPLSEGHTPYTDQSEELDKEGFGDHLPEFPSLDNNHSTNGTSDEEDLYPAIPAPQPHHQPITDATSLSELGEQLVTALIQKRMESALALSLSLNPGSEECAGSGVVELEDSDSDMEDFELLDQSELEQCEAELGLLQPHSEQSTESSHTTHTASGFISKLLRRH